MTSVSRRRRSFSRSRNDSGWNAPCWTSPAMSFRSASVLAACLALLACPGCLFLEEVNERPSVALAPLTVQPRLGRPLALSAEVIDDEPGSTLELVLRDAELRVASRCDYTLTLI